MLGQVEKFLVSSLYVLRSGIASISMCAFSRHEALSLMSFSLLYWTCIPSPSSMLDAWSSEGGFDDASLPFS